VADWVLYWHTGIIRNLELKKMKTRLLIIIGIMFATSSLFTIAYFTSVSYEVERCIGDTVYKDFTGEIIHRQVCISPFTGKTITDTFLGCDEGFKQINERCIQLASDCRMIFGKGTTEMYDCLEKIEKVEEPSVGNDVINTEPESTPPPEPPFDSKEHYAIEITGLKDVYIVGERYDFSYILSGYGHPCGGKTVTFPDSNGDTIGSASSASCIANLPMGMFVFDIQKEYGTTYGHVELKNPGTYTVTVTFDKPSQSFPTTVSQEFRVVEE